MQLFVLSYCYLICDFSTIFLSTLFKGTPPAWKSSFCPTNLNLCSSVIKILEKDALYSFYRVDLNSLSSRFDFFFELQLLCDGLLWGKAHQHAVAQFLPRMFETLGQQQSRNRRQAGVSAGGRMKKISLAALKLLLGPTCFLFWKGP